MPFYRSPGGQSYLWAADFSDDLPGFVEDGKSLRLRGVGARQTATQRAKQQMLETRREDRIRRGQEKQGLMMEQFVSHRKPDTVLNTLQNLEYKVNTEIHLKHNW